MGKRETEARKERLKIRRQAPTHDGRARERDDDEDEDDV